MQDRVFKFKDANVTVHIPTLSDEERSERIKEIKRAAELIFMEQIKK